MEAARHCSAYKTPECFDNKLPRSGSSKGEIMISEGLFRRVLHSPIWTGYQYLITGKLLGGQ